MKVPNVPFFPAGFQMLKRESCHSASVLESSKLAVQAFHNVKTMVEAENALRNIFDLYLSKIEIYLSLSRTKHDNLTYNGIDSSLNPSLNKEESLVKAFEQCPGFRFSEGVGRWRLLRCAPKY